MKKILIFLATILMLCSFTSCGLLFVLLGGSGGYNEDQVEFDSNSYNLSEYGDCIFVQNNLSDTAVIQNYNTAYISEQYRSADEELNDFEIPESLKVVPSNMLYPDDSFAIKLREEYENELKDNSRASYNPMVTATLNDNTRTTSHIRDFNVLSKGSQYNTVEKFNFGAYNDFCNVYYLNNNEELTISADDCVKIADNFGKVYSSLEAILGKHIYTKKYNGYINPSKKINILVFDIFGDNSDISKQATTVGYFHQADMLSGRLNDDQIIYIDSKSYTIAPEMVYSTLAHEYNHLLNFVNKTVSNPDGNLGYTTWFTEMLSAITEDMCRTKLGLNIANSPVARIYQGYYGFLSNYNKGFGNFNNNLEDYANVFAYGAYLVRNYGGFELLKEIATNRYVNEEAITEALRVLGKKYADGTYITFEDTILDEYNIVLNNSSLTSSLSLNKKVVYSSDTTLLFDKIDIYRNPLDNNRNIENDVKSILSQNYLTYRNRRGLGAYGFLVNYIDNSDKPYVTWQIPLIDESVYFSGMYELNY